jgi:hypothetical protein
VRPSGPGAQAALVAGEQAALSLEEATALAAAVISLLSMTVQGMNLTG